MSKSAARSHIPETQRGGPVEALEDGRSIAAGPDVLMVLNEDGIEDSGLWHEVQFASWDAPSRQLRVVWTQPDRAPIEGVTVSDHPKWLMEKVTTFVNKTIVDTRSFDASSGGRVTASVRRRADGELFSTVVVSGAVSDAEVERAWQMEADLRAELGMD